MKSEEIGSRFIDDIFKRNFLNNSRCALILISLEFIAKGL